MHGAEFGVCEDISKPGSPRSAPTGPSLASVTDSKLPVPLGPFGYSQISATNSVPNTSQMSATVRIFYGGGFEPDHENVVI